MTAYFMMIIPSIGLAHSGGTDSDGGHHCWTDCESYGYGYGEYHFHDGGYTEVNWQEEETYQDPEEGNDWVFWLGGTAALYYIIYRFSQSRNH